MKKNPWLDFEDKIDLELPVATTQIYEKIEEDLIKKEIDTHVNRASAATLCPKRRWFQRRGTKGTPLTPRKILNFIQGDIAEKVIVHFIRTGLVGPGKLYSEVDFGTQEETFSVQNGYKLGSYAQRDLKTSVGSIEVIGHADGFGKRNSDGQWELIEIKSAANYGFTEFKGKGPGDYLKQSHVLLRSDYAAEKRINEVRFFYLRKETGHIWDSLHKFDDSIWEQVVREFATANQEAEPDTPFELVKEYKSQGRGKPKKSTGRLVAQWQCGYCPYINLCHKGLSKEFKKAFDGTTKPVFYKNNSKAFQDDNKD